MLHKGISIDEKKLKLLHYNI